MAKGGKLTKLKSVLKKWNSFSKQLSSRSTHGSSVVAAASSSTHSSSDDDYSSSFNNNNDNDKISRDLHPVYVGKSRRRYLVGSDVVDNPVFQELVERSGDNDDSFTVGCEVVLFEHLLWMLENADPQPESLDDLVDYYAC
ncbi:Auxin-responsive protein SAUR76 [Camellia lanceoleosa]|uniref:Auxin-responsive protein SAUR76 n=1 Tax=Camellia lanceoleosa TaxID=1840588 RepID=A0ACC0I5N8_9ERIC|nr:Auxin-responsive protein SAUR76 [Camellia lanceoleosa]